MEDKMNKIVVWSSTSSRVSWLQVWKQMHLWLSFPISTCWWWEVIPAQESRKEGIGIERFGGTHHEILGMHPVQNWIRERGNLNFMSEILARPILRQEHQRKPQDKSSVEWRENMQVQAEDNYVLFSCEGARDTEDRMFGIDSRASMHNAEQGELSSDTMDTLRRSKNP